MESIYANHFVGLINKMIRRAAAIVVGQAIDGLVPSAEGAHFNSPGRKAVD